MNFFKKTAAAFIIAVISFTGYVSTPNGAITMTTEAGKVEFELRGTGTSVIDWGDGFAPDKVILSAYYEGGFYYSNDFSDKNPTYHHQRTKRLVLICC